VREGKVRHIGISNVTLDEFHRARTAAPIASVQNRYSLADLSNGPIVDACTEAGIVFFPYGPLGADASRHGSPLAASTGRLAGAAALKHCTPAQLALAWLLARSPVILPIPGTTSRHHLEENVGAGSIRLSPDEVAALAE
jgi:aryl-alcohol dehydrogenase-like predicted oxidoreductase